MSNLRQESLVQYSETFKVRYGEVNAFNELTHNALFQYLGEIAFNHADALAHRYESLSEFSYAVVWTRMKVVLNKIPRWKEKITIKTWISPFDKAQKYAFRNYKINDAAGQEIGYGYGSLLFFDLKQRKSIPIPADLYVYPTHPEISDDHAFSEIETLPMDIDINFPQQVLFSHLDQYKHVNNVNYLKWVVDSMDSTQLESYRLKSIELHFLNELRLNNYFDIVSCEKKRDLANLTSQIQNIESNIYRKDKSAPITKILTKWIRRNSQK